MNLAQRRRSSKAEVKSTKRLAARLPIIGQVTDCLFNRDSRVLHALALPNTPLSLVVAGEEVILSRSRDVLVCANQRCRRYLRLSTDASGNGSGYPLNDFAIAVLVIKLGINGRHVIDNIHVEEEYRRQGIGSELIALAYQDFPDLCLDGNFSRLGKLFFGALHRVK